MMKNGEAVKHLVSDESMFTIVYLFAKSDFDHILGKMINQKKILLGTLHVDGGVNMMIGRTEEVSWVIWLVVSNIIP
jgi:hypothetical protein